MFTPFAFIQPFVVAQGPVPTAPQYVLVGGAFTTYNVPTTTRLIKLNSTGSLDTSLNMGAGFNGSSLHIYQQPDGKYIIPGNYTSYSGSTRNRIVRINQNGTYDDSFNIGTGAGAIVWDSTPNSDNTNIIVGDFTIYSGSSVNRITKLNTSGARDTTFNVGTGFGAAAYRVAQQSDGKLIVGGIFTTYSGSTVNRIVRLNTNGTIDTSFNIGTGFSGASATVIDILIQTDGKILVGGTNLTPYSGSTGATHIIRINSDGTRDSTFNVGTGFNSSVTTMATESSGKIVVAGGFTSYSGSSVNRLVRLNTDGTRDTSLNIGTGFDTFTTSPGNSQVYVDPSNNIYAMSIFTTYSGSGDARYIVKIQPSGAIDTSFVTAISSVNGTARGFNTSGFAYCLIPSGSTFIIGGAFTTYRVPLYTRIAMTDLSGNVSSSFNMGSAGFNAIVQSFATQSDGKILAGGDFTQYSGSSTNTTRIIRLNTNGTQDTSFVTGAGFNNTVFKVITLSDGKHIVVGAFSTFSGSSAPFIVRLNANGSRDTSFNVGTGFNNTAVDALIQPDNKILVSGIFTTYSGSTANRLVRINTDGTRDTTFNTGTGFDNNVLSIGLQSDGKIVAGGLFLNYSGSARTYITRLNDSGSYDTSFNIGTGPNNTILQVAIEPTTNKIIAAGNFTQYSGSSTNTTRIIRLNTSGSQDTTFVTGTGFDVYNIANTHLSVESDGKVFVGGPFTTYSGSVANRIIRLNSSGSIDETFNQNSPNIIANTGQGANDSVYSILLL